LQLPLRRACIRQRYYALRATRRKNRFLAASALFFRRMLGFS